MKTYLFLLFCLLPQMFFAHGNDHAHTSLKRWTVATENNTIEATFLMFKDGEVYLENARHEVLHFPLSAFGEEDRQLIKHKYEQIEQVNRQLSATPAAKPAAPQLDSQSGIWRLGLAFLAFGALLFAAAGRKRRRFAGVALFCLMAILYGFKSEIAKRLLGTDPAFLDAAFEPFKPAVHTFWDANYFYVESKGIPSHEMMTGITKWQQQVPIPQCYTGANAWPIPLNPVIAAAPVPVNPQHFLRGAIAVAANGVPIFNPYTNTGVDAKLDGQLDNFGGHCGRADDYHYHIAPLQLDSQTQEILPIAFGLDGFAVYGSHEPDGSPMAPLDTNHGHYGANGVYHYHGTPNAPYMIGNMVGQVTEDNTLQIVPQAHANPVRPALTPLNGAVITGCQPNAANNGYTLTYTKDGATYSVDYNWTPAGLYTFHFITPTGTTTEMYNGFVQCQVPTASIDLFDGGGEVLLYPNPAHGGVSLILPGGMSPNDLQQIAVYDLNGRLLHQTTRFGPEIILPQMARGIYLVKIQVAGRAFTRKLMME